MIRDRLFRDFPVDAVDAMHNWPSLPVGSFVARDGAMMAAFGTFEVTVGGRGSHGTMPHEGVDPIPAACAVVAALHTVASRNVSPLDSAVVSATQIHAALTRDVARAPGSSLSAIGAPPSMAAEDFAFMLEQVPGCYVWMGAGRDGENPGLHSPRYDFNDLVLPIGANHWVDLVRRSLGPGSA